MFNYDSDDIMPNNRKILIVEDDEDDRDFLKDIFDSLEVSNPIIFFENSTDVIPYISNLKSERFMIFSDVNMPKLDGFELRSEILKDELLSQRCFPYIFISTSDSPDNIRKAFELSAQGYFRKEISFSDFKDVIGNILSYWKKCIVPV